MNENMDGTEQTSEERRRLHKNMVFLGNKTMSSGKIRPSL